MRILSNHPLYTARFAFILFVFWLRYKSRHLNQSDIFGVFMFLWSSLTSMIPTSTAHKYAFNASNQHVGGLLMDKIEEIRRRRKEANAKLLSLKSKVFEKFLQMEEAAYSDGALAKKQKELIAAGISVVIDCESCMEWHITKAAEAGASMREVLEAVEVGIEFGGGPATVSARFALEVMDRVFKELAK
jgi:AhpD family alkylhydroperoxidase